MPDFDPRLINLYDLDNPDGPDHDFYRALAEQLHARSIIDLGCGTGILTVTLTGADRNVVGIDPSSAMLDYARNRTGAETVMWILGDSRDLPEGAADLALMTGNVAQHIGDTDWHRTLLDLHEALRAGGTLAFESRNPAARAWAGWSSQDRTTRQTVHGPLVEWLEAEETSPGVVQLTAHNEFTDAHETVTETATLHFRDQRTVERQLGTAGFVVEAVYGDWQRGPVTDASPVMVFVAAVR
jgi:SAM-dependent methyltransferase